MNFIDKILNNYKISSEDYILKYKSDCWNVSFLNFSKNADNKKNLSNFRRNKILSLDLDDYGGFFQTIDALLKLIDVCGKKFIDENSETKIGNPDEVFNIGDKDYNFNDLHNINNLYRIKKNLKEDPKIILEIGGGYGCLSAKLKKNYINSKIICVDLPEALLLQSYYLFSNFPEKKFFLYEDFKKLKNYDQLNFRDYDFIILPPWAIKEILLTKKIDLIINIDSMMEMKKEIIDEYFKFIHNSLVEGGIFYNVNKYEKSASGDTVRISEYPYNRFWKVLYSKASWLKPNIHTIVSQKINYETDEIQSALSLLPKKNPQMKTKKPFSLLYKLKQIIRSILDIIVPLVPKRILIKLFKIYL